MQPTGAGDGGGEVRVLPRAEQPQQNVNVVAALCQQARGRRVLAAPVSADVRVGKVPPPDGFRVHHVEDVAHAPLLQQQPAQLDVVRTVAQHVPDGEDVARAAQRPVHVDAVPEARGQRLLAHDVQAAQLGEAHHDLAVEVVLDADKDGVHARGLAVAGTAAAAPLPAGLFVRHKGLPVAEAVGFRVGPAGDELSADDGAAIRVRLGDGDDDAVAGCFYGRCVRLAAGPGADYEDAGRGGRHGWWRGWEDIF
ncbi:hypothetical protein ACKVWC_011592 [Pyricularia oryzae]